MTEIFDESKVAGYVLPDETFPREVKSITEVGRVLGGTIVQFGFHNQSGPDHLKPGRPMEQRKRVTRPAGANWTFVGLSAINCAFTDGNLSAPKMRERPLGQLLAETWVEGDDIVCKMRLTDGNMDDPCWMYVTVNVLFFQP
ncbi:hypothetical protein [Bacillus gaemokensis]|uniref:Uncharacterized protein n=1 Tax=Bacillus gaemokensis TaxID=574375 RepID=A0A073KEK6_9BACI|nr:hypothetical protein [Bacillus gaemokensis]KEK20763.1 hypothetical protein BAGA_29660 [Bacillus gaemokensis]KYG30508.1 hypothetical protein AZF08_27705 [Bacillus gaemokensis]